MDISTSITDRHLSLFCPFKTYGRIFNRVKFCLFNRVNFFNSVNLLFQIIDILVVYYDNHTTIRVNIDDDPSLQKALNIQNAIIFIAPLFDSNYYHYQPDMLLLKCSYKLAQ